MVLEHQAHAVALGIAQASGGVELHAGKRGVCADGADDGLVEHFAMKRNSDMHAALGAVAGQLDDAVVPVVIAGIERDRLDLVGSFAPGAAPIPGADFRAHDEGVSVSTTRGY